MLLAALISFSLILATVIIHYEVLRGISVVIPRMTAPLRSRVVFVIIGIFCAHVLEIGLYSVTYALMITVGLGSIEGQFTGGSLDYFYFSVTSYTTLGVGDLFPHGPLRIVAGLEALNGFVGRRRSPITRCKSCGMIMHSRWPTALAARRRLMN